MQLSDSLSDLTAMPSSSRSQSRASSSTSDICARLDRLETQVSSIQRNVRTILSYQRQSLGIPDPSSSSESGSEEDPERQSLGIPDPSSSSESGSEEDPAGGSDSGSDGSEEDPAGGSDSGSDDESAPGSGPASSDDGGD
ncbi:suppressor protein SRP40-like [Asparagus officinalis]|uniref:suppressor protein SRP40-like n=1 Tax=Asparagus officinalis TaxID=4686 RepID=UPI00098E12FA|nr:suppressor protein SRP40-like [Asparagus officinalis]